MKKPNARLEPRKLTTHDLQALSPITIVARAQDEQTAASLVTKGELLTMEFDEEGRLLQKSCNVYYTGP